VHFAYKPLSYTVQDAVAAALADGRIQAIFDKYRVTLHPPELR
jgi:hypothetical protein